MIEIIPDTGILTEWSDIEERLNRVVGLVSWAQVDFCDNTWIQQRSFHDFSRFADIAKKLSLEAHFMCANPEKYITEASKAGFKRLIAHVEAHDPRLFLEQAEFEDVEVGMAIDGATEFEQIEPFLENVDFVQVMTAEAGFTGHPFLPEAVEKIKSIHSYLPDLPIEASGGISEQTIKPVVDAGATRIVVSRFIYNDPTMITHAIEALRSA